jgi:hypothetical protein
VGLLKIKKGKGISKKLDEKKQKQKYLSNREYSFLILRECYCGYLLLFFYGFYLRYFDESKNKLRTNEPRIWKKIKNNPAPF